MHRPYHTPLLHTQSYIHTRTHTHARTCTHTQRTVFQHEQSLTSDGVQLLLVSKLGLNSKPETAFCVLASLWECDTHVFFWSQKIEHKRGETRAFSNLAANCHQLLLSQCTYFQSPFHTQMHVWAYMCLNARVCVCVRACFCACTHRFVRACIHVCMYHDWMKSLGSSVQATTWLNIFEKIQIKKRNQMLVCALHNVFKCVTACVCL